MENSFWPDEVWGFTCLFCSNYVSLRHFCVVLVLFAYTMLFGALGVSVGRFLLSRSVLTGGCTCLLLVFKSL
jgi:hypothetical protein